MKSQRWLHGRPLPPMLAATAMHALPTTACELMGCMLWLDCQNCSEQCAVTKYAYVVCCAAGRHWQLRRAAGSKVQTARCLPSFFKLELGLTSCYHDS